MCSICCVDHCRSVAVILEAQITHNKLVEILEKLRLKRMYRACASFFAMSKRSFRFCSSSSSSSDSEASFSWVLLPSLLGSGTTCVLGSGATFAFAFGSGATFAFGSGVFGGGIVSVGAGCVGTGVPFTGSGPVPGDMPARSAVEARARQSWTLCDIAVTAGASCEAEGEVSNFSSVSDFLINGVALCCGGCSGLVSSFSNSLDCKSVFSLGFSDSSGSCCRGSLVFLASCSRTSWVPCAANRLATGVEAGTVVASESATGLT